MLKTNQNKKYIYIYVLAAENELIQIDFQINKLSRLIDLDIDNNSLRSIENFNIDNIQHLTRFSSAFFVCFLKIIFC